MPQTLHTKFKLSQVQILFLFLSQHSSLSKQVGMAQVECLSACEDQINNVGVTSSGQIPYMTIRYHLCLCHLRPIQMAAKFAANPQVAAADMCSAENRNFSIIRTWLRQTCAVRKIEIFLLSARGCGRHVQCGK